MEKVFSDASGFQIKLTTGPGAFNLVHFLEDNYLQAHCTLAWTAAKAAGFHPWNPPTPETLGARRNEVSGDFYYINGQDLAYLEQLEQLISA